MRSRVVRVLLVEDHAMVLDAIQSTLHRRAEVEVAATARTLDDAVELLRASTVDVVVSDLHLGASRGTELVAHAAQLPAPVPVLLITGADPLSAVEAALSSGCAGFVSKSEGLDRLVDAVVAVADGAAVFPSGLLSERLAGEPSWRLSDRELEILRLLATARSVPDIAAALHLSVHTVRNHVKQILGKLGAHSQLEAVVIAARHGVVEIV